MKHFVFYQLLKVDFCCKIDICRIDFYLSSEHYCNIESVVHYQAEFCFNYTSHSNPDLGVQLNVDLSSTNVMILFVNWSVRCQKMLIRFSTGRDTSFKLRVLPVDIITLLPHKRKMSSKAGAKEYLSFLSKRPLK